MAELAGVMVGNYFLLECLGREGMVETYRARPTSQGGFDVVLRLFRPPFPDPAAFQEHFASEVEKVWHCHHEHIQPLLEFGAGEDLLFCVTESTEAETLEQVLQRTESQEHFLPLPLVVRFISQLCAALQYAHEQQIVHGNIQPSSILVQSNQQILLTDFSMKRIYQEGEPLVAQIEEGNLSYVAPEQVVGMLSPASDIYAVGVLLYRLLTGNLPYDGESAGEIALKHANEAIPSLRTLRPELPESVELVVRVALAKSPEARFPGANALAEALVAAVAQDSPPVVSVKPQRRIEVRFRRRTPVTWSRALSLLAISLVLFGLIGTLLFFSSLPLHLQDIPGLPFHTDTQGGVVGTKLGKPTPTTAASGVTPSTPTTTGSNSGPPVHITPTVDQTPTPLVNGTAIPTATAAPPVVCASRALVVDSSLNLQPLLQQIDTDYTNFCPGSKISLRVDGSRASLNKLEHGRIDVAGSDLTAASARNLSDHSVGALLYALIASPDVEVSGLSSAEIQNIYQGQITNWAAVGGSDQAIRVVLPPATASITAVFQTFVLDGATEHAAGVRIKKDAPAMVAQTVSQMPGAISFVPLAVAQETGAKILAIDGIRPGTQALLQGTYAFWSIEHLYTQSDDSAAFQAYMQFITSSQEANAMAESGVVPMIMLNQSVLSSHLPGPEL
ncbi:MAG TPA: serine/threonine-protein kinase [Ktedonobacteraceae bacterium]